MGGRRAEPGARVDGVARVAAGAPDVHAWPARRPLRAESEIRRHRHGRRCLVPLRGLLAVSVVCHTFACLFCSRSGSLPGELAPADDQGRDAMSSRPRGLEGEGGYSFTVISFIGFSFLVVFVRGYS